MLTVLKLSSWVTLKLCKVSPFRISSIFLAKDSTNSPNAFLEGVVCKENEIEENSMKVCDLGEEGGKVLLVKQGGRLRAVGTRCSHYGAPLVGGALGDGRIRCPWHGACFNINTGDIEDFPGLDSIPCYSVRVEESGDVVVRANRSDLETSKRMRDMAPRDPTNKTAFVIIGAGAAGQCCVETLRQEGFTGRIVMITSESYLPYDRIKLSKQLDVQPDKIQLRPDNFYKEHGIEVMLGSKVVSVDTNANKVNLENGTAISYTRLLIASGSQPRVPDIAGVGLKNIFTLRSLTDAMDIFNSLKKDSNVLIYGSSFIGMEAAAYCVSRVKSVTVVGRSLVPFRESLGERVGARIAQLFSDKGVTLCLGRTITQFLGDNDRVNSVTLSDGSTLPADVVILGLGATPATSFLSDSPVNLSNRGFIHTNQFLESNVAGVHAAGDVALAPVHAHDDLPAAIGHWGLAHYHGRVAALNMLAKARPLRTVPFFWTVLFGTSFRYTGYSECYDEVLVGGSLEELKFAAYYCHKDSVVAVCTVATDPIAAQFAEAVSAGSRPSKQTVQANLLNWHKLPPA